MHENNSYKKILDAMGEALWMGDQEEKTVYANPAFLNLVEYELSEILGKESYIFWDDESASQVKKENLKRKQGKSSSYEGMLISKSGKKIPVKITGTSLDNGGTVGIMSDQREILSKMQREKILYQAVQQSTDAVLILDTYGNILSWNTGAQYIFGYKSLIGKHISLLFGEEDIQNILQTKNLVNKYELKGNHKSGNEISVSVTQTSIPGKHKNEILYYLITCRDISNYRKIETEIRSKYDKIKSAYSELGIRKRQIEYIQEFIDFSHKHKDSPKKICDFIVASVLMLSEVDGCEILLYRPKNDMFELTSYIGFSQDWIGKKEIPYKNSLTEKAILTGESIRVYDLHSEILYSRKTLARQNGMTSLLIIPLTFGSECLGSLGLYTKADKKLEIFENEFIEKYAKIIALALKAL